ncbi:MAG: DUF3971 domain-containing protein, partial [Pseudomonadota bacterium]
MLEAALRGEGAPTRASFSAAADAEVESLSASIELDGVTLSQMADLFAPADLPVAFEGATNVSLSATASEDLGVETIELSASSNGGQFVWGDLTRNVDRLAIDIGLDIAGRQLDIVDFDVDAEGFGGRYSARVDLEEFFEGVEAPDFPITLSAQDIVFDATPMFEAPWSISSLELGGRVKPAERTLDIGRAIGSAGSFSATASGEIYLGEFEGVTELGVRLEAAGEGASTEDALAFWPVNLGKGARDWVKQNVSAGRITEAVYAMNFPPGANSRDFLDNDVLNLAFSLEGGEVSFLSDLPPATEAKGRGVLRGNSLSIELDSGKFGEWILDSGNVEMPAFYPRGGDMTVTASGRGDLKTLLEILEASRLRAASRYGVDVERVSGPGGLDIEIVRPMLSDVPIEDVSLRVVGGFVDAAVPDLAAGFGL